MRRAVFLARDGVISAVRQDYTKGVHELALIPGSLAGLRVLSRLPFEIVVVTNQSAVNRGLVSEAVLETIHQRLKIVVAREGGRIDDILFCPHLPVERCSCRKPQPGMLLQASWRRNINLTWSYMVGDSLSDVEAALVVGVRPILVLTGCLLEEYAALKDRLYRHIPVMTDLLAAARLIEGLEAAQRNEMGRGEGHRETDRVASTALWWGDGCTLASDEATSTLRRHATTAMWEHD